MLKNAVALHQWIEVSNGEKNNQWENKYVKDKQTLKKINEKSLITDRKLKQQQCGYITIDHPRFQPGGT